MPAEATELTKLKHLLANLVKTEELTETNCQEILGVLQNVLRENWTKAYHQALEDLDLNNENPDVLSLEDLP